MAELNHESSIERRILEPLLNGLRSDVQRMVIWRLDAMIRHLEFIAEQDDDPLMTVLPPQWTVSQLRLVCGLNSFYQIVLAPLSTPARDEFPVGLITDVPLSHGSNRFDAERTYLVRRMMGHFRQLLRESNIPDAVMEANQVDDMLNALRSGAEDE